ncbi:MAG TPA: calcium-binding protein [Myxococcota bacterium]|nr:calcium-binding protein [Myxococcota bacterium]
MTFWWSLLVLILGVSTATLFPTSRAEAKYTAQVDGDSLVLTGDNKGDALAVRLTAGDPTHLDIDVGDDGTADFNFDRSLFTAIAIHAGAGRDTIRIDEANGLFTDEAITIDGGPGNDTITGGSGDDTILGGDGNDVIDPRRGADTVDGGPGNDQLIWDPGDGSDVFEGGDGNDVLVFNGSNANEKFDFSANGARTRMTRDVASITMDMSNVEEVDLKTLGGTDTVTVNDLTGTQLALVSVDFASFDGGPDGAVDTVVMTGTAGPDVVSVGATNGVLEVDGVTTQVQVTSPEGTDAVQFVTQAGDEVHVLGTPGPDTIGIAPSPTPDAIRSFSDLFPVGIDVSGVGKLVVFGLGGDDMIVGQNGLRSRGVALEIDGGAGDDTLTGGDGDDVIFGGGGDDTIRGGIGSDTVFCGPGKDTAIWNPGDGSDTIEGDGGQDTLLFNGSNAAESIDLSANGSRLRLFRNVASITMDVNAVEQIQVRALGSADDITVNDLAGTDVKTVGIDLAGFDGSGDGAVDTVRVNGTNDVDRFALKPTATGVSVKRKNLEVDVDRPETTDSLVVNGLGGGDKFVVDPGVTTAISLTLNPD